MLGLEIIKFIGLQQLVITYLNFFRTQDNKIFKTHVNVNLVIRNSKYQFFDTVFPSQMRTAVL